MVKEASRAVWEKCWVNLAKNNLPQCWHYGEAKGVSAGWKAIRYIFEDRGGNHIGSAQILLKNIRGFGAVARLNRGPLLNVHCKPHTEFIAMESMLISLMAVLAKRRCWILYVTPDIEDSIFSTRREKLSSFQRVPKSKPWGSATLHLGNESQEILKKFKGKWRNLLKKAQKLNLKVVKVDGYGSSDALNETFKFYEDAQKHIGFSGIPTSFLEQLAESKETDFNLAIFIAQEPDSQEIVGVLISAVHGNTATYLVGNTTPAGRKLNANYGLLWEAILDAKASGCVSYDLGGLNENTPKGVAHFKQGLNGEPYKLIGDFVGFPVFSNFKCWKRTFMQRPSIS